MALSGVKSSKWRSFLTMLGIITGIVAVVLVVGIGEGVKRQIAVALNDFGDDLIIIRPEQEDAMTSSLGQTDVVFGMSSALNLSTADADLVSKAPGVGLSAPLGVVPGSVEVNENPIKAQIVSSGADLPRLLHQGLEYGDFWTDSDEDAHFAVLGQQAVYSLFDEPVPLGKSFVFRGQSFQVRGVFKPFDKVPFSPTASFDNVVFIPYKTAARLTNDSAGPYAVLAKPADERKLGDTIGSIRDKMLEARGGESDFSVLGSSQSLEVGNGFIRLLSMWILAVAAISLLMGGVGIMNIMLLVVTERMHEIGVRKAVGATSRQILGQFVLEATVLSMVGGAIGIALSTGVIGLMRVYTDLEPVISWTAIGIAAGAAIAIGVIFGSIPAIKAASKDPIEALRHE
jgi:ABC-type antimicrobial peptide transport system permease subunit